MESWKRLLTLPALLVLHLASVTLAAGPGDYTYAGEYGPSHWGEHYDICAMERQSPIDFTSEILRYDDLDAFDFSAYDNANAFDSLLLENVRTSVKVTTNNANLFLSGGGFEENQYQLLQFHFHWGSDSTQGSEHTVDGAMYPLELHFVHYDPSYGSVNEALAHGDGLAVIGVIFEISEEDNPIFDPILNNIDQILYPGDNFTIPNFAMSDFIPDDTRYFYRYEGSLTTPACYEAVQWTVLNETLPISETQLAQFRTVFFTPEDSEAPLPMENNYRPVQELHGRVVRVNNPDLQGFIPDYVSPTEEPETGAASGLVSTCFLWLSLAVVSLWKAL